MDGELNAQIAVAPMEGLCLSEQKAHSYSVDPIDYFSFGEKKPKTTENNNSVWPGGFTRFLSFFVA